MSEDKNREINFNQINLAFLTSPFLLSLITVKSILIGLQEMGEATEEVFRGTRLPLLNFSESKQQPEKNLN